jgi:hypothetical protein
MAKTRRMLPRRRLTRRVRGGGQLFSRSKPAASAAASAAAEAPNNINLDAINYTRYANNANYRRRWNLAQKKQYNDTMRQAKATHAYLKAEYKRNASAVKAQSRQLLREQRNIENAMRFGQNIFTDPVLLAELDKLSTEEAAKQQLEPKSQAAPVSRSTPKTLNNELRELEEL